MIRCIFFSPEGRISKDLSNYQISSIVRDGQGLLWVDFENTPPERDEITMREVFGFHPLAIDDALQEAHVPKLDDWGDYLYIVLYAFEIDQTDHQQLESLIFTKATAFQLIQNWESGFWVLLSFGMQMCLIIMTGYILATTPIFSRLLNGLAGLPKSNKGSIALMAIVSMGLAWINWGLSIVGSAVFVRFMVRKQKGVDYRLLVATAYLGLGTMWHSGLSASAPLLVATPKHFLEKDIGIIPITETIFHPFNLLLALAVLIVLTIVGPLMHPKKEETSAPANAALVDAGGGHRRGPGNGAFQADRPRLRPVVSWINSAGSRSAVISVDIPSGLFADSASLPGPVVRARRTVTFTALKLALVLPPAASHAGRVTVAPIGSPPALLDNADYRTELFDGMARRMLPPRTKERHKGTYGHVFVVAGSRGKSGAALMTGQAALRAGAGLVTLLIPAGLQRPLVGKVPELMTESLPETPEGTLDFSALDPTLRCAEQADALVIGPGLTTHDSTRRLVRELVRLSPVPIVLDAHGINAFAGKPENLRNQAGRAMVLRARR